jgi:hypothetical protein
MPPAALSQEQLYAKVSVNQLMALEGGIVLSAAWYESPHGMT